MVIFCRTIFLVLIAVFIGCNSPYYLESLTSQLPRADGSMLNVECRSTVRHAITSISPTLQPEPQVAIVMDERTLIVHADEILLDNELLASLSSDVKKLRIEVTKDGFKVRADGRIITEAAARL